MEYNTQGQLFASFEWLKTHFYSKTPDRVKHLFQLPINKGDKVLDMCCGPGFYAKYFLDMVGPEGTVTGIDHDPELLKEARSILSSTHYSNWSLVEKSIADAVGMVGNYNKILIFNCLCYFDNPLELIRLLCNSLQRGSMIIIKDIDIRTQFVYPTNLSMYYELMSYLYKADQEKNNCISLNNYFGSSLHSCNYFCNIKESKSQVWNYIMKYPFTQYQRKYISTIFDDVLKTIKDSCRKSIIDYALTQFNHETGRFFDNCKSVFIENEHLIVMTA